MAAWRRVSVVVNVAWLVLLTASLGIATDHLGIPTIAPTGQTPAHTWIATGTSVASAPRDFSVERGQVARTAQTTGPVRLAATSGWVNLSSNVTGAPPDVAFASSAYDASDGYVVRFGGSTPDLGIYQVQNNYTWTYRSGNWTNITSLRGPCPRDSAGMVYDARDGYVVLFGGRESTWGTPGCPSYGLSNDTWEFSRGVWTQLHPAVAPEPRYGFAMVYDAADGYVVLWGGNSSYNGTPYNDTWTFVGGNWSRLVPAIGPSYRLYPSAAYLSSDQKVILFGGETPYEYPQGPRNQTWAFSNGTWTNVSLPLSPPTSDQSTFGSDSVAGALILFVGSFSDAQGRSYFVNETWRYTGSAWLNITAFPSPPTRDGATLTEDPADGYLLLSGGQGERWLNDTWAFITAPGGLTVRLSLSSSATDVGASVGVAVAVTGAGAPFHYRYTGLPLGCSSVDAPSLICSPRVAGTYVPTVWVTNSTGAVATGTGLLTVNPAPQIQRFQVVPNPTVVGRATAFTFSVANGTLPYGSYGLAGLPPGCVGESAPWLVCDPSASGTYTIQASVSDAVGFVATSSLLLSVANSTSATGPLGVTRFEALPNSMVLGNTTTIDASTVGGTSPLRYSYVGLPTGCTSINMPSILCRPSVTGTFLLEVDVTDALGSTAQAQTSLLVRAMAPLTIASFLAVPDVVALGQSTHVLVSVVGGLAPLRFAFTGLPPDCPAQSTSDFVCLPLVSASIGNWSLTVRVSDGAGIAMSASTELIVTPANESSSTGGSAEGAGFSLAELLGVVAGGALAGAALGAGVVLLARRRRTGPPPGSSGDERPPGSTGR